MIKISSGRYQEVFREKDRVFKVPIHPASQTEMSRMEQYHHSLSCVGVSVPRYFRVVEFEGRRASEWEYKGKPLTEALSDLNPDRIIDALRQIFRMGLSAYEQNVAFYPILEQFTLLDDRVYFVDFFPPRTREDFEGYAIDKRDVLSVMFYGLTQKLVRPSRQLLATDSRLKKDVEELVYNFLTKRGLGELVDHTIRAIDFDFPNLSGSEGTYAGINERDRRIKYYRGILDVEDLDEWILTLPSRNVWTQKLFRRDLEKVVSLGLIKSPK